jgi:hypothetical protein
MMNKNDKDKTVENESCLKVSDWVTFLTSEKQGTISTVVGFGALLVALVVIVLSAKASTTMQVIENGIMALVLVAYAIVLVFRPFGKQGEVAEKILNKIMSGDLKDESTIRQEWKGQQDALKRAQRRAVIVLRIVLVTLAILLLILVLRAIK